MSDETDREALAGIIRAVTDLWDEPLDEVHDLPQILNAILASNWLAADRAATRRQALDNAADDLHELWVKHGKHFGQPGCYSDGYEVWLRDRAARIVANLRDGGEE